jgi:hypothetical protein
LAGASTVSGLALWLAARNAHLDSLRSTLAGAHFVWLIPYPFICIVLNLIRGEIWRILLRRRAGAWQAFWAYSVGFVANNVLPFRVGEAARVVVLSARSGIPLVEVAATAGLERLLDLAMLSLMLAMLGPAVVHLPGLAGSAVLVAVLVAGALVAIAMLARFRERLPAFVRTVTRPLPLTVRDVAVARSDDLTRGLTALVQPGIGVPAAVGASVVWILTVVLQWLVLRAFQPEAGAADAAFMVAAVSFAIALPAAPGFVGVYHLAGQQSLTTAFPHLYDASTALAAATVAHAVSYITSTALGVIGLWYFGLRPAAMTGVLREKDDRSSGFDDAHSRADSHATVAN